MKRNIVSLIIATTIITGVMPTTANAETVNSINILKEENLNIKYKTGNYIVKNEILKEDVDKESAARNYISKESLIEITEEKITANLEFTNKKIMENTKIKVNGEEVEYVLTDVSDTNSNLKFELNSLEDKIEVSTTINLGFTKMSVSFRVKFDITDIPVISDEGSGDNNSSYPEEKPEEVKPIVPEQKPEGDNKEDEEAVADGKYTIENDALHISKDEESMARKYLETISDVEYKNNKIYLILKFTGKSMMANHVIEVNGDKVNFEVVDETNDNFYVKFEISSLSDNITVSTKVLGTMNVEFRVKLKSDTLKIYNKEDEVQKPDNNNNSNNVNTGVNQDKGETQIPTISENKNSSLYKIKNEIITDSAIGYTAARSAVNSTSYVEDINGEKYVTVGLSQLDVMSNIRVSVNGANINYEVVRRSGNTMEIKFKIPTIGANIKFTAFINVTGMDISFGLDLLESTMEVISKSEANLPLATKTTSTILKTSEDKEISEESSGELAEDIEVGEYFKKYTIENDIISDSAIGKAMTRKYLDKLCILEEIDGKLYLTLKFSGTNSMRNIKVTVNGEEVKYSIVAHDEANEMKAFRFSINNINDEIRIYMNIKAVNMDVDFGVDLLEETKTLVEEGTVSNSAEKEDIALATLMNNKKEGSNLKVIVITALITSIMATSIQGIIYLIINKRKNKRNLKVE
ncbi:NEAT domain-containing protein [uncultured Clostridium sp.]|uniref:NEAT domain-containing protein n=2 Tax=uncultured Clostridium sp. TaxID=59620 RepID=UPI0026262552|nr:NEAT domain-containing protein [uncultured Clostridium sp.]